MHSSRVVSITTIVAIALLSACSSSGHSTAPPPSTTTTPPASSTPGGPRIVSLNGPPTPVLCYARDTSVQLHWETRGATKVSLQINGGSPFATYAGGRRDPLVPLTCDGNTQTYQLTARDAAGRTATRSLAITERAQT